MLGTSTIIEYCKSRCVEENVKRGPEMDDQTKEVDAPSQVAALDRKEPSTTEQVTPVANCWVK